MASNDPPHVPTTSFFGSLLEQSRKLRQETDTADLPPIELGLGEIERRAKELGKAAPSGRQTDARAYVPTASPRWRDCRRTKRFACVRVDVICCAPEESMRTRT